MNIKVYAKVRKNLNGACTGFVVVHGNGRRLWSKSVPITRTNWYDAKIDAKNYKTEILEALKD